MAKLQFKGPPKVTTIDALARASRLHLTLAILGWAVAVGVSVILVLGRH